MATIKLGDKVKDLLTGFEGIATGHATYLYGCSQLLVSPDKLDKDDKRIPGEWFDEQRVALVEAREKPDATAGRVTSGGPQADAPTR